MVKRVAAGALVGLALAAPAHAADPGQVAEKSLTALNEPQLPAAIHRALRYLPPDGYVLHYSRASRRVVHIKMAEEATPDNDWFGLPPDFWKDATGPMWITVYTVRYERRQILVCVGGLGVVKRYSRRH